MPVPIFLQGIRAVFPVILWFQVPGIFYQPGGSIVSLEELNQRPCRYMNLTVTEASRVQSTS